LFSRHLASQSIAACRPPSAGPVGLIIGIIIAILAILLIVALVVVFSRRRAAQQKRQLEAKLWEEMLY
jgi:hypothetical protein